MDVSSISKCNYAGASCPGLSVSNDKAKTQYSCRHLGDYIGFHNREENKILSNATIELMCHIFSQTAVTGNNVILEANFHEAELEKLHSIADENKYDVLTLVLRGNADFSYQEDTEVLKQIDSFMK